MSVDFNHIYVHFSFILLHILFTALRKIQKDKGTEPSELEEPIAQAFFDLENTNSKLKSDLKDLYINSDVQIDVYGSKKVVVIHVPYRLRKAFKKIHVCLTRELEKKFSEKADTSVDGFLQSLGLQKYQIQFQAEEVDMIALEHMTDEDLKAMGLPMTEKAFVKQPKVFLSPLSKTVRSNVLKVIHVGSAAGGKKAFTSM